LLEALESQIDYSKELQELKSVEAHLRADVVEGNSPLTVNFDVGATVDPAGGTIQPSNIVWDLKGEKTFEGEDLPRLSTDVVVCNEDVDSNVDAGTDRDRDVFGTIFRQCTFKQPGTYIATITVSSNDNRQFVPGTSFLSIKVNPPTTNINLDLEMAGREPLEVIGYYENGILKVDKDYVAVTLDDAKNGINFNASETGNINPDGFRWSFGDGTVAEGNSGEITHAYEAVGQYRVELEVLNRLGQVDRKIFTLDVRNVAARIDLRPEEDLFIDRSVRIDGSKSSSTSGEIRSYSWKITKSNGEEIDLGRDASESVFDYIFQDPGKYIIELTIKNDLDENTDIREVVVKSKDPVAQYQYEMPDTTQPSTVHFDAQTSFDPDGDKKLLTYEWSISSDSGDWDLIENSTLTERDPIIRFNELGNYDVTLKVTDSSTISPDIDEEFDEVTKTIEINSILDVAWDENQSVTEILNTEGNAEMDFKFYSNNAIAYEIDFGDGDISSGDINFSKTVTHTYSEGGRYRVKLTVYDEDDNDNTIEKTVLIGGGDDPIAKIRVVIGGTDMTDFSDITVNRKEVVTFDASESKNTDGTGRNLRYSWTFGDTGRSSNKRATHAYDELSPESPGYFRVRLTVTDRDDPDLIADDDIRIRVVSSPPRFDSLQAIPEVTNSQGLVTPVKVNTRVFGADDVDGQITQYRWWYYNVNNPSNQLGLQITQSPNAQLTIGTSGREGQEITYGFGVEVTDSDNLKVNSFDILDQAQIPTLTVTNGPNAAPSASFNVDATKVFVGDTVNFTSSSKDPDGNIVTYVWDIEGDGFFNNEPTKQSSIEHIYEERDLDGIEVRLKVVDDKGGEAVSQPVKIFVDTLSQPPNAAFTYSVQNGVVTFQNNSTADQEANAEIAETTWDFDTNSLLPTVDSDGDGVPDNDKDSLDANPIFAYDQPGVYEVKLTVKDNFGATDEVVNNVDVFTVPTDGIGDLDDFGIDGGGDEDSLGTDPQSTPGEDLVAVFSTTPQPSEDGIVYLNGDEDLSLIHI